MNVAIWLLGAILALPVLEIVVFVAVALTIGFGWALAAVLATSLTGAAMLRYGGAQMSRIRVVLGPQRVTALEADSAGTMFLIAGILLLIPGFITDVIGVLLLIAPLRRAVAATIMGAARRRAANTERVVDLEPAEWRQVPQEQLDDRREPPPRREPP
jgi:UPF0716 protein FxsA